MIQILQHTDLGGFFGHNLLQFEWMEKIYLKELEVYPNPSRDIFNISFKSDEKQNIRLRILNLIGEEIFEEDYMQYIGEYTKDSSI